MSNLGLEQALVPHGVEVVRCGVGDREVAATMRERGIVLGGEQSGHLVCSHFSTTGDGLLTALRLAELLRRDGRPVAHQLAPFRRFPQVLENVRVRVKTPFDDLPEVRAAVHAVQAELGDAGRLVLRYSGTEPLARIMLEGPEEGLLREWAERIAGAIRAGQPASPVEEAAG
jgi:phosphoglucosamine mutase